MTRTLYVGKFPVQVTDMGVSFFGGNDGTSIPVNASDDDIKYIVRAYIKGQYLAYYRVVHGGTIPDTHGENVGHEYRQLKAAHEDVWKD
jgi:hypothetical protein